LPTQKPLGHRHRRRVVQQLREAFPEDFAPRYLLFDRDAIFGAAVVAFVKAMGTDPVHSAYRSPWQNPVAERWIASCRRDMLDHVVVFGERHLVTTVTPRRPARAILRRRSRPIAHGRHGPTVILAGDRAWIE